MSKKPKSLLLNYGIPSLALVVVLIQLFFVNTQSLNKWKGGGYGMYTEIHYYYNQIYIPGMMVDSMIEDDDDMKTTLGRVKLMPNHDNLKKAAALVLETTQKDSIHIQIWKPTVNSTNGVYSRVLVNEIRVKNLEL